MELGGGEKPSGRDTLTIARKDVSSGAKEFKQHGWLPLGEMGITNRRESSVLFLKTTCTSTVISVKSSVKKKAWSTKALWYGAELK